jgi:Leucine-rich repeat (LRR) protein
MKSNITTLLIFLPFATSMLLALASAAPLDWTSAEGKTIQAEFIRLDGAIVVVRKGGKELPIPLARLSLASRNQAQDLAAKLPAANDNPAEAPTSAKSFGKQEDPNHQRKLAESILAKKGQIEVWRGTGHLLVTDVTKLPAGKLALKSVDAIGAPFSEEDGLLLNGCEELTRLRIHRSTLESLPLKSLTALNEIDFFQCRVEPAVLAGLTGNKSIRALSCHQLETPMGPDLIEVVAACPNLETLNLHKAAIGGATLAPLSKLKFLKNLYLGGNDWTDTELMALSTLPILEHLNISESNLVDHNFAFLRGLKSLRSLDLTSSRLGEQTLSGVAEAPSLAVLQLNYASLSDAMLRPLSGHKGLRELLIVETAITGEDLASFKSLPNLIKLHFGGGKTRMSEEGFQNIIQICPNVSELAISAGNLSSGSLTQLSAMRNLSTLMLTGGATLGEETIRSLSGMKLKTLGLDGSKVSDELLAGFRPLKSTLAEFWLRDTRVSDASLATLEQFHGLSNLYVSGTDISKDGAERLRKSLQSCTIHH